MTNEEVGILMLGVFILCVLLGFPIWATLMAMGIAFGYYAYYDPARQGFAEAEGFFGWLEAVRSNGVFELFVNQTYSVMANDVLTAVPLFLFMGYIVERANIVDRLFGALQIAARNIPGSMAVAALATCAMFATATGIIGAVVTLMGMLAFPAMLKAKYDTRFASGVICAGGCLGILIPPSIMLIVYAAAASVSVVQLYAGAIFPGFMLAGLYMLYVIAVAMIKPEWAPKPSEEDIADVKMLDVIILMLQSFFPLAFLILSVLGAILFGLATPSEAASMGAGGGLLLAIIYRLVAIKAGTKEADWAPAAKEAKADLAYALGAGAWLALTLLVAYFVIRILATNFLGAPQVEGHLPVGPGFGVGLAAVMAVLVKFTNGDIPVLSYVLPKQDKLRPLMNFGAQGALIGLIGSAAYIGAVKFWDPEQDYFIFHEFNPWAVDVGFYVGLTAMMAWRAIEKKGLQESVYLSVRTSAMVCWLFVGSWVFSSVFSYLGGEKLIEHWVLSLDLTPVAFLLMAQVIIFLLGWPLEWSEIIIIFVPIFLPLLPAFNVDPLFFGVLVALNLQTSFLTPPMAMAAYYLKGVAPPHVQLIEIFKGCMPFLSMVFVAMILLYNFPEIALGLPEILYGRN